MFIMALVKSSSNTDQIRGAGAELVLGSYDNFELIAKISAESEIIVNAADSDDDRILNALLEGQKRRMAAGKALGSFVQTIGNTAFMDGSKSGSYNTNTNVWTVSNIYPHFPLHE